MLMQENDIDPLTKLPPTLDPYRRAAIMVAKRLSWDVKPVAWSSKRKLRKVRDSHAGKKAVILCNGPSLLEVDFSSLEGVFTFGLNKINLLFDKTEFRPSAIASVNALVIEQNRDYFNETDIPLFLDSRGSTHLGVKNRSNVAFLHSGYNMHGFARDCSMSITQGFTVTYVALQLAFHYGFTEVAVVGCDHNFADKGPANKTVVSGEKDVNHFDPNYFAGGVKWQLPDLFESEVSYQRALNMYEAFGRRLVNCTTGGKLEIFPRESLDEFLNK